MADMTIVARKPFILTPARREQRKLAGKASYRVMVRHFLETSRQSDGSLDLESAAARLSVRRRGLGMRLRRGITSAYMAKWAENLGLGDA